MDYDAEKPGNFESETNLGVVPAHPLNRQVTFSQKIQLAKDETNNKLVLCLTISGICLGTIGCKIISVFFILLPIAMIIFGTMNLNNCPKSDFVPIYLLVQGICTMLDVALIYFQCHRIKGEIDFNMKMQFGRFCDTLVIIWFIIGSVFIYRIYEPNYDPSLGKYCDKTTYLFAFWSITIVYLLVMFIIITGCCVLAVTWIEK